MITQSELLLVSKSPQERLKNYADGVTLSSRSKCTIAQLQYRVSNDRLQLARAHLKDAQLILKSSPPLPRSSVSRAYYAMYHAARAATYISFGGDDHEQHSVLPNRLPDDFPNSDVWKRNLKEARLERNRADYDPYPKNSEEFERVAKVLLSQATEFVKLAQKYIRLKAQ